MTVMRRERAIRPDGRNTEECPERDNGLGRKLGRDAVWGDGGGGWRVDCERSSSILLRGLQEKRVPRVSRVSGRKQIRL